MGTSSWRASPVVGNAFMDDTNAPAAVIFFFTTDGKSFMSIFNCSVRSSKLDVEHPAYLSIYVFKRPSSSAGCDFIDGVLNMRGSDEDEGGGTGNDMAP
jgi:hypothetical protein